MDKMQKIDQRKLADYSKALSEKLTNEFFILNTHISGEQILKFTPLEQVNLFIIKNLFDKWKEENSKLKSPYFDYDNEEVKEALNSLLVKLSQHISVKKDHFIQLLNKAIYDTFSILFEPVFFLSNEYLIGDTIVISELKERGKYIRIHKGYFKKLIEKVEGENKLYISKSEAELFLGSLTASDINDATDTDSCLQTFSSMLKIELNDLLIKPIISEPVIRKEEPAKKEEAPVIRKEEPVVRKEEPVVVKHVPVTETMINEKFATDFVTLNDKLKHEEGETLIQKHSKRKIADMKEAITLNQKFIFIKELMNGDASEYNNMLSAIDQCDNYQSALHLLNNNYSSKWNWVADKTEVKEFYSIVERKFN